MRSLRIVLIALLGLLATEAQAADLWRPKGSPGFTDSNGKPLASGKLCFYDAESSDQRTVYKDSAGNTAWTQPITLDSAGKLSDPIYVGTGEFKEVLRSASATDCDTGSALFTADDIPGALDVDALGIDYAKPEQPILSKSSNYTVTSDDLGKVINVDTTGGAVTLTLPSAIDVGNGGLLSLRKTDASANTVTASPVGGQTISGSPSLSLSKASETYSIVSDGANWYTVEPLVAGSVTFAKIASSAYDTDPTLAGNSNSKFPTQAAVKSYVDSAVTAGVKWKEPVRVATTTNGTLSSAYENGDTIDGVTLATNDRILIKDQSSQTENGIYVVKASGAPDRAADADEDSEIPGATVFVTSGSTNAASQWSSNNTSVTIGATNIEFVKIAGATYTADESTLHLNTTQFSIKDGGVTNGKLATDSVGSDQIQANAVGTSKLSAVAQNKLHQVGEVYDYLGSSCPGNDVKPYGQALSRSTYSALFAVVGTNCGAGDGSTTFTMCDYRGRVAAGEDDMGGTSANRLTGITNSLDGDALYAAGGGESFTIAQTNLPNVTWPNTLTLPNHTHSDTFALSGSTSSIVRNLNQATFNAANGSAFLAWTSVTSYSTTTLGITGSVGNPSSNPAIDGSVTSGGSGTALSKVQPTIINTKCVATGL